MTPLDLKICRGAHDVLISKDHDKKNYLFTAPVDLAYFTDYAEYVKRPMDLRTLRENLESGMYENRNDFFSDAFLCFDNAQIYHRDKPENNWIVKMAVSMKKLAKKEAKRADKIAVEAQSTSKSSSKLKLSLKTSNKSSSGESSDRGVSSMSTHKEKKKKRKSDKHIDINDNSGNGNRNRNRSDNNVDINSKYNDNTNSGGSDVNSNTTSNDNSLSMEGSSTLTDTPKTIIASKPKVKLSLKSKRERENLSSPQPQQIQKSTKSSSKKKEKGKDRDRDKEKSKDKDRDKEKDKYNEQQHNSNETKKSSNNSSTKPKSSKPKLKLILSLNKKIDGRNKGGNSLSGSPSIAKGVIEESHKSSSKKNSSGSSGAQVVVSRGKELPSTVASSQQTSSSSLSNNADSSSHPISKSIRQFPPQSSRGKELPKGAASSKKPPGVVKSEGPPSKKIKLSISSLGKQGPSSSSSPSTPLKVPKAEGLEKGDNGGDSQHMNASSSTDNPMTPSRNSQCHKVLSALRRRKNALWFLKPISDPKIVDDYHAKIKNAVDIGTISSRLDNRDHYKHASEFVKDIRRIFANCLRYNTDSSNTCNTFRPVAREMIGAAEDIMDVFIAQRESEVVYPKLLYCWKSCLQFLDDLLSLKNADNGYATAHYFLHPVSFYFDDEFPREYLEKVKTPMDFGTITSKLFEGNYCTVDEFIDDCRLVHTNCNTYHSAKNDEEAVAFKSQADTLNKFMSPRLDKLIKSDRSLAGIDARKEFASSNHNAKGLKAPMEFYKSMMQELRASTYKDKFTKINENATKHFEDPVDISVFPDYLKLIDTPLNLKIVDKKIETDCYNTPEDFEYDVMLIFKNCEIYNMKRNDHIVNLAKYCSKTFRKLFLLRIKAFELSGWKNINSDDSKKKRSHSPLPLQSNGSSNDKDEPPMKKTKTESSSIKVVKQNAKRLPDQSLSTQLPPPKLELSKIKASKNNSSRNGEKKNGGTRIVINAAIPRHVAIAQIKSKFPNRRHIKALSSEITWEGACARFFRELVKHPWIRTQTSKNKFTFDAPVPIVFPEVKHAYASKITSPMDLTTAECKLLQGDIYQRSQEFVDDVALVFANAVTFNRDGHEDGDALSCAYFDASNHLLRYTRWLSLENLTEYLDDANPKNEDTGKQWGPLPSWKLTVSNKVDSRKEMDEFVMNQRLEKSEEGDRFTWMEAECEKLLKCLRHQSDFKQMSFFVQSHYPDDYSAYVAKPMDWECANKHLYKRKYDTFGEVIDDLRLIFSNSFKYNGRAKGTDTASGRAFEAAGYMSKKLEAAVDRTLFTVCDRVERDKLDQIISERDREAIELAEQVRLKKKWQNERELESKENVTTSQTLKIVKKSVPSFCNSDYLDEEPIHEHEESQLDAGRHRKSIYEKQKKAREKMFRVTLQVGFIINNRLKERADAITRVKKKAIDILLMLETKEHSNRQPKDQSPSDVTGENTHKEKLRMKLPIAKRKKSRKFKAVHLM